MEKLLELIRRCKHVVVSLDDVLVANSGMNREGIETYSDMKRYYLNLNPSRLAFQLAKINKPVYIFTSRYPRYRFVTISWLKMHGIPYIDVYFMPKEVKRSRNNILKFMLKIFDKIKPNLIIEGDEYIARCLKSLGYNVILYKQESKL